jgi:hypothetical protein
MNVDVIRGLSQPDGRSCGPSCLVAARMLIDAEYAARIGADGFGREVLEVHHRVTGIRDARGARQLPWPPALGTAPWAVARELSTYAAADEPAVEYGVQAWLRRPRRERLVEPLRVATAVGHPVVLFIGDRWLPRHVVLAIDRTASGALVYNPAGGGLHEMPTAEFVAGRIGFSRWTTPWFVVLPTSTADNSPNAAAPSGDRP